jgi:hypothetical protein
MFVLLQVVAVTLASVAMALSLAHALELPGKLRLAKVGYLVVQTIYYPGFTIGGMVGDAGGLLTSLVLLAVTPAGSESFGWTLIGAVSLAAMNVVFWIFTQPANRFWLREQKLTPAAAEFFAFDPLHRKAAQTNPEADVGWTQMRTRWEYSHVARAVLAGVGFLSLVIGLAVR